MERPKIVLLNSYSSSKIQEINYSTALQVSPSFAHQTNRVRKTATLSIVKQAVQCMQASNLKQEDG
jgi:hypothetical protein